MSWLMRFAVPFVCLVLVTSDQVLRAQNVPAASRGASDYLSGLTSLTTGNATDAATSFSKAIAADDENALYHTVRAIALYLADQFNPAADEFERAKKLGNSPVNQLWGWANSVVINEPPSDYLDPAERARQYNSREKTTFDSRPPYEAIEPYTRPFIDAATFYAGAVARREPQRQQLHSQILQYASSYAWREMSSPKYASTLMASAKTLYDQQKYPEALALLDHMRSQNSNDPNLLYYSAGCKLATGDFESARDEFTRVLIQWPEHSPAYLGRARAAANMGSMERANKDLEIAASIDPKGTETYRKSIADQLQRGAASVPKEPMPELLASLRQTASNLSQPMTAVTAKAERLMRAAAATRFIKGEAFTEELQRLDSAATADPKGADKQAALGEFLVNPTVVRPVRLPGKTGNTRIPVGDADIARAMPAIDRALSINPNHINALTQKALAFVANKQPDAAIQATQKALDLKANNLDLSKIHLDYYTNQANGLASEAYSLRQPKRHTEYRAGGEYLVTVYPSPAELARADELDRQADGLRRKAATPLQALIEKSKGTIEGHLANAELLRWSGKYDQSIAAANEAIKLDPWNLDAHEFLVDLCPKVNMMDVAIEHQNLLNNLANPSAGRTLDKVWDLLTATKYRSARETIDEAEKVDPASPYVPAYRAAVAQAEKKSDEFTSAVRQAVAMEEAKQRVNGRTLESSSKAPLSTADVGLTMALRRLWAIELAEKPAAAADQYRQSVALGQRVASNLWDAPVQASALPAEQNAKPKGWTIRELLLDAQFNASKALLAANDADNSAKALMSYIRTNGKVDLPPGAMDFGYEIYKKLGQQKASQYFTQNMLGYYQVKDNQQENREILQRGDDIQKKYEQKIEELRQRQQDLDTQIAAAQRARNTNQVRALQQQRQALSREFNQAIQQMNQEQMQNINPRNPDPR